MTISYQRRRHASPYNTWDHCPGDRALFCKTLLETALYPVCLWPGEHLLWKRKRRVGCNGQTLLCGQLNNMQRCKFFGCLPEFSGASEATTLSVKSGQFVLTFNILQRVFLFQLISGSTPLHYCKSLYIFYLRQQRFQNRLV